MVRQSSLLLGDRMEHIEVAECFRDNWKGMRKNEVLVLPYPRGIAILYLALPVSHNLDLIINLYIGKRKGLRLFFWAYDPRPALLADQAVNFGEPDSLGALLDLLNLREKIRRGADPVEACLEALEELRMDIYRSPSRWDGSIRSMTVMTRSRPTISGGLPGTRRSSRGKRS